jgi:hypothetical protein
MNLYPDTGKTPIDLSNIAFETGYIVPRSGTIASYYHKGFELSAEVAAEWKARSREIASEFILGYYHAQGLGDAVEIWRVAAHDDCIDGLLVSVRDKIGFTSVTYGIWESGGKIIVEDDRR